MLLFGLGGDDDENDIGLRQVVLSDSLSSFSRFSNSFSSVHTIPSGKSCTSGLRCTGNTSLSVSLNSSMSRVSLSRGSQFNIRSPARNTGNLAKAI